MALQQQQQQQQQTIQSQQQHLPPLPAPVRGRKRVKVYELKNNDWYDRGTGFCSGDIVSGAHDPPDARIVVQSEEEPERILLETRITKDDGHQQQQETLIVWTESDGVDMALSFQEAEGCGVIWGFISEVRNHLVALAPEDALSDDLLDQVHPVVLPEPQLGRLDEIESAIRVAASTPTGRDALSKFIMSPEQQYIMKLAPLVEMAEDLESTADLHRLCTIMKHLILLNDTSIIEFVVTDAAIMGVVGALEYDPDFPSHRANHRQYLSDSSKFKEVVRIEQTEIRRKIHYTYRLLYLKDVVLARILDDPTFSVLNSLIFFHQVEIVNHLQSNLPFLKELFAIFTEAEKDANRKKEGVLFIQNCCAVSKNIQAQSRAQLFQNFIGHGLFSVITFALRHHDPAVRVAGTDILVALIDHDPQIVRGQIFNAIRDKTVPLTDTLIELLLVEVDLGVKSQMADAIKILLDPGVTNAIDMMNRQANAEYAKQRGQHLNGAHSAPQTEVFVQTFYDDSAKRLFAPLHALEQRASMQDLSVQETSLFTHLVEVLCFFVRQHNFRSKLFIIGENLHSRIAQLLQCPQKHMKLTALKWFRTCIGLQDDVHNRHIAQYHLLEPILGIVEATMPRDNLLNSACLELFEFIRREHVKTLNTHLVEAYRERMLAITYVNTFHGLVDKYDQMQGAFDPPAGAEETSFTTQEGTPQSHLNGRRFHGLKEMDPEEEAYFNAEDEDEEDEEEPGLPSTKQSGMFNSASPVRPLVNYPPDDDEDDGDEDESMDLLASSPERLKERKTDQNSIVKETENATQPESSSSRKSLDRPTTAGSSERGRDRTPRGHSQSPQSGDPPLEPLAAKRRRAEEEDEDELSNLGGIKRRNSSSASSFSNSGRVGYPDEPGALESAESKSGSEGASLRNDSATSGPVLRRKGSLKSKRESSGKHHVRSANSGARRGSDGAEKSPPDTSKDASNDRELPNGRSG